MPLSKQAKALYEAALRRKGLQPGKAVRQDPRTFVGPIETHKRFMPVDGWEYNREFGGPMTRHEDRMVPSKTYWAGKGRFQDLEDELNTAMDEGIWERKNPTANTYYRYYNDGDLPRFKEPDSFYGSDYDSGVHYKYEYPYFDWKYPRGSGTRRAGWKKNLTRLGEMELEARADEMIENDYKDYLRKMYEGKIPVQEGYSLADVYDYMPYDVRRNYYERLPYYYRTSAWPDRREYHKTKEGMERGMREARNIGYSILDYGENPNAWTIQDMIEGKIK